MKETRLIPRRAGYLFFIVPVVVLLIGAGESPAQKNIHGTVTDAETGETLPAANIQILDTYRGTITNEGGAYTLTIPDSLLPATIEVRYLGYESRRRTITGSSGSTQDFRLTPSIYEMEAVTVTGEDPAEGIMREVIRRKKQWREKLDTYRAEAYTRQVLSNDTAIVSITESVSEVFWDKRRGHREVHRSKRQTDNIQSGQNFAGVSYLPNFYDDDITIAGFDMVGITHPDALEYYDFAIRDTTGLDGQPVYEIEVIPARKLQPLFQGRIFILDKEYALLEVDLRPNEVVVFPPPVKNFETVYRQQFSNFGGDFWLPVDVRINADIKIAMTGLEFPEIIFKQVSRITGYRVNTALPDSLYEQQQRFSVDSASVDSDSLLIKEADAVPLSVDEEEAYATLDSTATLEKAFKPSGFLAHFVNGEDNGGGIIPGRELLGGVPGDFSPSLRYNRVDELHLRLNYTLDITGNTTLQLDAGYSTGYDEWGYGGALETRLFRAGGFSQDLGVRYRADTAPRVTSEIYKPLYTSLSNLLGQEDYFDYYRSRGYALFTGWNYHPLDLALESAFQSEFHSSLPAVTAYDLFGRENALQYNPPIAEGRLNSISVAAGYNLDEPYNFGITGRKYLKAGMEYSSPILGSDFSFTKFTVSIDWSFPTFFKRRFLPNTLDIHLTAGTSSGNLPLQKTGSVDGTLGAVSPFGALRTLRWRPYEGNRYVSAVAEHNFRTIPFEALGLKALAERNFGIIIFGGIASTDLPEYHLDALPQNNNPPRETGGIHTEAGLSINGILGLFRIDFAQRLDRPSFRVGISTARIF